MALPTTKTPPKSSLQNLTLLMHGRPKIGKSTWCSNAESALFLATEPGLNSLECFQMPVRDWTEFGNAAKEIADGKHNFKTIIVDTVDNAYGFCRDAICKRLGINDPADLEYGKGFSAVNNEWHRVLTKLASLGYGLYLISHSKEVEVDGRTGKVNKWVPTLPGKASEIVTGLVDMIVFADVEVAKNSEGQEVVSRVLRTKPHINWEAGDRTKRLPPTLPLDYAKFVEAWTEGGIRKEEEKKAA